MAIIYILLAIIAAIVISGILYVVWQMEEIDESKEKLDKYSVYLDERANRLAAEEMTLRELYKELQDEINKQKNGRRVGQKGNPDE